MQTTVDIAIWMQSSLLGLDGEDWSVGYVTDLTPAVRDDSLDCWQLCVDFVYRTLTCDLIGIDIFVECQDKASLLQAIRTVDPYEDGGGFLWNGTRIYGTSRLNKLVDAYFPSRGERDGKLNPTFIEALEQNFAENGVPWSDKPLLPIIPNAGAGATEPR